MVLNIFASLLFKKTGFKFLLAFMNQNFPLLHNQRDCRQLKENCEAQVSL
jgi:hypothetical protein